MQSQHRLASGVVIVDDGCDLSVSLLHPLLAARCCRCRWPQFTRRPVCPCVRLFVQHRDNARLCSPQTPRNIGSQLLLGNISAPSKHGRTVEMSELEVIWSSLVWESVFQHYVTSYISSAHTLRLFGMTEPVEVSGNPFVNTALKVYGKLKARKPEKSKFSFMDQISGKEVDS